MRDENRVEREPEHPIERQHVEGRPSGPTDADGLKAGRDHSEAPTEAPEERGDAPTTEHAPGGDL
jgi:hypothetical protein